MTTKSLVATRAVVLGAILLCAPLSDGVAKNPKPPKMLEFDTMVGIPSALTDMQAPIRGIKGGGLPWTVGGASGELRADGHLELAVSGLVFAAGPNTGSNTITAFHVVVSCIKADGTIENIATGAFPATTGPAATGGGDAAIETDLVLPQPCLAPLVFVTSPGLAWFAVTGR